MAKKRNGVKKIVRGATETFAARRRRLGAQGVSLAQETTIVDNLIKKARARGETIGRREALRRFRLSQETTIGKTGRGKTGVVSRKTGNRVSTKKKR